jgi:hypothetical protein
VESGTSPPVVGDFTKNTIERRHVTLQARQDLHNHLVTRKLSEILGDLALAEGIVERVVDYLRRQAIARCLIAIDRHRQSRAVCLLIRGNVAKFGQSLHLGEYLRSPLVQLAEIRALQGILELGARGATADAHILCGLKE